MAAQVLYILTEEAGGSWACDTLGGTAAGCASRAFLSDPRAVGQAKKKGAREQIKAAGFG